MRNLSIFTSLLVVALAACSSSTSSTPANNDGGTSTDNSNNEPIEARIETIKGLTGNAAAGETVYTTTSSPKCIQCHKADGKGSEKGAPSLVEPSANDPVEELAGYILNGKGKMPKQESLTDQEIADVIAYMKATFK